VDVSVLVTAELMVTSGQGSLLPTVIFQFDLSSIGGAWQILFFFFFLIFVFFLIF
jgi:hypothetical protein